MDDPERRNASPVRVALPWSTSCHKAGGSILMYRRDLEAAEFFILAAIAQADRQNIDYPAAQHDLAVVRRFKRH